MSEANELKAKSDELGARRREMEYEVEVLDALLRVVCEHKTLLEAPFREGTWFGSDLPVRLCEDCGLEEHAWTFHHLTGRAYQEERHKIYGARRQSMARIKRDGTIYVGSSPAHTTNDQIINGEPCGKGANYVNGSATKTCTLLAGHRIYPCSGDHDA